jgi:N-methylhydantoinase A
VIPPDAGAALKRSMSERLAAVLAELRSEAMEAMTAEGFPPGTVTLRPQVMVRYGRQLNDLIVAIHTLEPAGESDFDAIIASFERQYEQTYARAAKFPQAGYHITDVGLVASSPKVRPRLREYRLTSARPSDAALKGTRLAWFRNDWHSTKIYEFRGLAAGNRIAGPAIIEDRTTTYVVPPGRVVEIDRYFTLWLRSEGV